MINYTNFATMLEHMSHQLDAVLRELDYEAVSDEINQSSAQLADTMRDCAVAIRKVAADKKRMSIVRVTLSDSEEPEVLGASIDEEQLEFLLNQQGALPVIDQHGNDHRLTFDMDGQTLVLLPPENDVTLNLLLSVTYSANDTPRDALVSNLEQVAQRGIGDGMLTGVTPAEVSDYTLSVF
ncbi:hypothetical protein [Vogesella indigofera]|uniref:Uncharacterized protein n=1 Tax=Vogesella indigofera TaxID=45465 RepID=A0ABT5I8M2_VOGIN|nr:hypothetical protein [Vogesella indigofera]MDC7692537.1 hypothetical protein [Vogesella indigofera]